MVVVVFVMVACDLLLIRAHRVSLDMRMKETTSVSNVFQRQFGAIRNV